MSPVAAGKRTRWAWWVATFFGAGWLKPGPGTYGSVAAAGLWFGVCRWCPLNAGPRATATLAAALIATLIGIRASTIVARESGRKDPGFVVIDEVAGQLVTLAFARPDAVSLVLAILLFRLFDIFKPWPIRRFERLPEGTGIMMDDIVAGLFGLIVFCLLIGPLTNHIPLHRAR